MPRLISPLYYLEHQVLLLRTPAEFIDIQLKKDLKSACLPGLDYIRCEHRTLSQRTVQHLSKSLFPFRHY